MPQSALPDLQTTIHRHGLAARKSLGQHFLLDPRITDEIVKYAGEIAGRSVIEIGPGPGGLTRSLLAAGAKVYAVEMDERCVAALEELVEHADGRLAVVQGDALTTDLLALAPAPRKIVANLPYNVGTELLIHWLMAIHAQGQEAFESLTLMFQKEVAERIVATHGNKDYGRLSVLAQWLCEVRYDMELPPGAFSPPPKVSSAVVTLTPRAKPLLDVELRALEKVMAAAFGQRRKMLRGALKSLGVDAQALLEKAGIEPTLRAEQVPLADLCRLAQCYATTRR